MRNLKNRARIVIVVVLAVLISASAMISASAADNKNGWASAVFMGEIDGFSNKYELDELFKLGQSGSTLGITVYPGEEIRIPITADMFNWDSGRYTLDKQAVTVRELRSGGLKIRTKARSGSEVLEYVQFNTDTFAGMPFYDPQKATKTGKTAYISIKFTDEFFQTEEVEFDFEISLTNGRSKFLSKIELAGVMVPNLVDIHSNTGYVYIGDATVAEAQDYAKNVKFDLGNGITVTKNATEGQKYFGICGFVDSTFISKEEYPDVYPLIHGAYRLETINLSTGVSGVKITPPVDKTLTGITDFYVYGDDLQLLGKTSEELPYADTYVLTYEEIPALNTSQFEELLEKMPTKDMVIVNEAGEEVVVTTQRIVQIVKYVKANPGSKGVDVDSDIVVEEQIINDVPQTEQKKIKILPSDDKTVKGQDVGSTVEIFG